jgi:hypothetical protein
VSEGLRMKKFSSSKDKATPKILNLDLHNFNSDKANKKRISWGEVDTPDTCRSPEPLITKKSNSELHLSTKRTTGGSFKITKNEKRD